MSEEKGKRVVYIAGKMRGLKDLGREHFRQAEEFMEQRGWTVINPAGLPTGLREQSYMPICLAMLREADAIALLPDFLDSVGATMEKIYAGETGKQIIYLEDEGFDFKGGEEE